jgi:gamma-glutamyltranspeptidase/glutathione hydrolase
LTETFRAPRGLVCSPDHLASSAGLALLRAGGSAADAAVATSAVLAVTSPHMCGMGGDLLAVWQEPGQRPVALNASGRAGSGADPDRLRAEGHTVMPFRGDIRSVPVPGCVDGWLALHEHAGRRPLAEVLTPAVRYAADGFPASPLLAAASLLVEAVPGAEDLHPPMAEGQIVRRPGVAAALEAVISRGRDGFYAGPFGRGLIALGRGEYTAEDLAVPLADWVPAVSLRAWDHDLWTVPPNSQGYLTLAGAWIAAGLSLPPDPDAAERAHLLVEAARQAGHDRPAVLHEDADPVELLDLERLRARRAAIDPARACAPPATITGGGTIALCVVDDDRRAVSLLQSNASDFGAHLAVPGTGILLHNRGIGFHLEAGHPAEYRPGRRPPHTLAPLIATRPDGALRAVTGTMGGDTQPQTLLQVLARHLEAGQSPGAAIGGVRWRLANPDGTTFDTWRAPAVEVLIEHGSPDDWEATLTAKGHRVRRRPAADRTGFGHAHLIAVETDHLAGAADPRSEVGAVAGW